MRHVVNRPAIVSERFCYECGIPGRYKYQVFVQVAEGEPHQ